MEELFAGYDSRSANRPSPSYARDGSERAAETEASIAELVGVEPDELIVFNTGMTAMDHAINSALHQAIVPNERPTILFSNELYHETTDKIFNYIGKLTGAKLVPFQPGEPEEVERAIKTHKPNLIVAETVANFHNASVLNIDHFRECVAEHAPDSISVLDNTLPLSTALPLGETLNPDEKIMTIESGTKILAFNGEMAGHAYSKNKHLVNSLRKYRRNGGGAPGEASLERIQQLLPESRQKFDEYNKTLLGVADALAPTIHEGQERKGNFSVNHPSVTDHLQHEYSKEHLPNGTSPVIFVFLNQPYISEEKKIQVGNQIAFDSRVRQHADIGQSFGFDKARILVSSTGPVIRIAAGAETDTDKLGPALRDAIIKSTKY